MKLRCDTLIVNAWVDATQCAIFFWGTCFYKKNYMKNKCQLRSCAMRRKCHCNRILCKRNKTTVCLKINIFHFFFHFSKADDWPCCRAVFLGEQLWQSTVCCPQLCLWSPQGKSHFWSALQSHMPRNTIKTAIKHKCTSLQNKIRMGKNKIKNKMKSPPPQKKSYKKSYPQAISLQLVNFAC